MQRDPERSDVINGLVDVFISDDDGRIVSGSQKSKRRRTDRLAELAQLLHALLGSFPAISARFIAPIEMPATQSGCKLASANA
jgi:hypothetical protein